MLHRLEIENFYSILDRQVIDLRVAANAPDLPSRFGPAWLGSRERVPKVVTLLGPNASGKSNVLRALSFLSWFIQKSFELPAVPDVLPGTPVTGAQRCEHFFSDEGVTRPTRLCIWFAGPSDQEGKTNDCRYAYEVSFENSFGKPTKVLHEAIHFWPGGSRKKLLFERDAVGRIKSDKIFGLEEGYKPVRANVSAIAWLAQFDHVFSIMLQKAAGRILSGLLPHTNNMSDSVVYNLYATMPNLIGSLNRDIDRLDLGLKGVRIVFGQNGATAEFEHDGLNRRLPPDMESHGTQQFIRIFPLIALSLAQGGIAVIDELDTTIHPLILPEIIRWFRDSTRNPHDAQLWTTCHNASLLEHLVKEEVVLCEKDWEGRTSVYSLQDVKGTRRDDNHYRKYMGGVYGAVPHIG